MSYKRFNNRKWRLDENEYVFNQEDILLNKSDTLFFNYADMFRKYDYDKESQRFKKIFKEHEFDILSGIDE